MSNGPGELAGWAFPLARAVRRVVPDAWIQLALPPCQYATGREAAVAEQSGLFDRVYPPREVVWLALGGRSVRACCVVHVGGDLWYAARLGRRARCPAVAYVERDLVVRRHRAFVWIATSSHDLAQQLVRRGVPPDKVEAVGDLRADAVEPAQPRSSHRVLLLLPGSRPDIFEDLAPLMLQVARWVQQAVGGVEAVLVPSPFLEEELVRKALQDAPVRVAWTEQQRRDALAQAALALTLPGTSNVELGLLGIPMLVWLPLYDPARVPLEGLVEWIGRLPLLGPQVKAWAVRRGLRRLHYASPVNATAGELLVEEEVSDAPPEAVAARLVRLLLDPQRLVRMREGLQHHFQPQRGAAERLARRILELAS